MSASAYPTRTLWSARSAAEDPLAFLQSLAAEGGDVIPFRLGRRIAFLLNHPRHVEDVLVRNSANFLKGPGYQRAARLLGNGLLTASGPLHTERRRLTQTAFDHRRMPGYGAIMVAHAATLRDRWHAGTPIDAAEQMRELSLGIAGEALLGVDLACKADTVRRAVAAALPTMDGLLAVVAGPRHTSAGALELRAIVDEVVEVRRRSRDTRDDLLGLLLGAHDPDDEASTRQLQDEAVTFLVAGHDTVAHALTWTWTLLADHPHVDALLEQELSAMLGGRLPAAEDLSRLAFTRAVLAEAMRLFPPAWVIVRRASAPHRCGDVEIPAGAMVVASPFLMHRDPRFFPEPSVFDPARWLNTEAGDRVATDRPKLSYFPFGAGPRSCVGEGFAWMEGTLVLATIAQAWRLPRADGAKTIPVPKITLRPQGPVLLRPERRSHGG